MKGGEPVSVALSISIYSSVRSLNKKCHKMNMNELLWFGTIYYKKCNFTELWIMLY